MTKAATQSASTAPKKTPAKTVEQPKSSQAQANTQSPVTPIGYRKSDNTNGMTRWLRQHKVFGYLHSIREIPDSFPQKMGATITVPQGENRHWETFMVVINFFDAHVLFKEYEASIKDKETRVTVWFDVTNIKSQHFIVEDGEQKGDIVDYWSCTLTNLSSMSIDGNVVYKQDDKISIPAEQYYQNQQ